MFQMAPSKKKKHFTETLIELIKSHPAIWNKTCKDYKDSVIRSNAWANVGANLKATFEEDELKATNLYALNGIKGHWKNLQDTYRNKKKKSKGKSGAGLDEVLEPKEWEFFEALRFLDQSGKFDPAIRSTSSRVNLFFGDESSEEEEDLDDDRERNQAEDERTLVQDGDEPEGDDEEVPAFPPDHQESSSSPSATPANEKDTNQPAPKGIFFLYYKLSNYSKSKLLTILAMYLSSSLDVLTVLFKFKKPWL